jgi:hypothetical protein
LPNEIEERVDKMVSHKTRRALSSLPLVLLLLRRSPVRSGPLLRPGLNLLPLEAVRRSAGTDEPGDSVGYTDRYRVSQRRGWKVGSPGRNDDRTHRTQKRAAVMAMLPQSNDVHLVGELAMLVGMADQVEKMCEICVACREK